MSYFCIQVHILVLNSTYFLFLLLDVGERVCSRVSRSEAYPSEELLHDYTTSGVCYMCFDAEDSKKSSAETREAFITLVTVVC